jgi:hypothetical protein
LLDDICELLRSWSHDQFAGRDRRNFPYRARRAPNSGRTSLFNALKHALVDVPDRRASDRPPQVTMALPYLTRALQIRQACRGRVKVNAK